MIDYNMVYQAVVNSSNCNKFILKLISYFSESVVVRDLEKSYIISKFNGKYYINDVKIYDKETGEYTYVF